MGAQGNRKGGKKPVVGRVQVCLVLCDRPCFQRRAASKRSVHVIFVNVGSFSCPTCASVNCYSDSQSLVIHNVVL